ncbi:MAG: DUF1501 domain-containing protein [Pirellulales bacterium]|nr:DUF1501 domain-containing protein [Pirellulales bacterium]
MSAELAGNHRPRVPLARRELLYRAAAGFGGLALTGLLGCERRESGATSVRPAAAPAAPNPRPIVAGPLGPPVPRAKHVIFLYMDGGPSQMDLFDPKPRLNREHGEPIKMQTPATNFNIGNRVMGCPYKFAKHGACGADVSEIMPHVATCVDDLTIIRSMVSDHGEHAAASYFMHSGSPLQGRPSMGAWINYGFGTESQELPGFVVLECGMSPFGGLNCFSNGFLPPAYQACLLSAQLRGVADLEPLPDDRDIQGEKLAVVQSLNRQRAQRIANAAWLENVIGNYEQAFRMQTAVPRVFDFSSETAATLKAYGIDQPRTQPFGTECLVARRLIEQGVRFIELLPPRVDSRANHWDQHSYLERYHRLNAEAVDQPIAALIKDLKQRGLLEETLLLWGGEFGRTPMSQKQPGVEDGRDHNPFGFTMWLAGGGVKGGLVYGATDEYGYYAVENPVHVHDLHATILYLLGVDHTALTYQYGGRDYRLTDVYGNVVGDIVA